MLPLIPVEMGLMSVIHWSHARVHTRQAFNSIAVGVSGASTGRMYVCTHAKLFMLLSLVILVHLSPDFGYTLSRLHSIKLQIYC